MKDGILEKGQEEALMISVTHTEKRNRRIHSKKKGEDLSNISIN